MKTTSPKGLKTDIFPKGLTHCFGPKMAICFGSKVATEFRLKCTGHGGMHDPH